MLLVKIILLQLFWFSIVLYGKMINPFAQIFAALIILLIDFYFYRPKISLGRYLFLLVVFLFFGFLNDSSLIWLKLVSEESYQYGNLALWIVFLAYYEKIFVKFEKWPMVYISFLGGIVGAITYWSAAKMGAVAIIPGRETNYLLSQFIFWSIFFPLGLKLYFRDGYWDKFLDKTIFFSFDKTGYLRHKKKFTEDLTAKNAIGKNALVTGGTGGIGAEVSVHLSRVGARTFFTGRNEGKGMDQESKNLNSKFVSLDMANWKEVYQFAKNSTHFDYIVLNAGSMPQNLSLNEEGVEFQCASQLLGHYYLLVWLREFGKISEGARIVWVSSGGMYLKKLDLSSLFDGKNYEKVDTYANVKRAQVTLVEELAKESDWKKNYIYSMHPGWVNTEGLKEALPKFYRFMNKRLRSPLEGADTILWCLLSEVAPESGKFYFDRKQASPYISSKYNPSDSERMSLMKKVTDYLVHNQ